jgi:hypothetical protein
MRLALGWLLTVVGVALLAGGSLVSCIVATSGGAGDTDVGTLMEATIPAVLIATPGFLLFRFGGTIRKAR